MRVQHALQAEIDRIHKSSQLYDLFNQAVGDIDVPDVEGLSTLAQEACDAASRTENPIAIERRQTLLQKLMELRGCEGLTDAPKRRALAPLSIQPEQSNHLKVSFSPLSNLLGDTLQLTSLPLHLSCIAFRNGSRPSRNPFFDCSILLSHTWICLRASIVRKDSSITIVTYW